MKKLSITVIGMCLCSMTTFAITPSWLRDIKVSPDGTKIAFTYKGDIYTVPFSGGEAKRLTTLESYETTPIWSPDSKQIAFASDRNGNFDIFIMDSNGGKATRLTYNSASEMPEAFTPDGKYVLYSAAIQDPTKSALFPSSRLTELYRVSVKGGNISQILGTPAQYLSFNPKDSNQFLYQAKWTYEDEWRKHHTSSATRDLWLYDGRTGKHTNIFSRDGEDRNPIFTEDGNTFYFLSERDGKTMNVYQSSLSNPSTVTAVTKFKTHPVRFLSRSLDGKLVFGYDGDIYTLASSSQQAQKVKINLTDDTEEAIDKLQIRSGASDAIVSPDGKSVAFTVRGDVFVTSVEYSTTKQITNTPAAERDITWGSDGKSLYYSSNRDGHYNIYKATMGYSEDPNWANATIIEEKAIFTDKHERTVPQISPNGKKLAYIQDRHKLMVMDLDSKKVSEITDGSTYPQNDGRFNYSWSPDSKWIALEINARKHEPYSDIAIVNIEKPELTNLTNTGYFDASPKWVMNGNAIIFESERMGMRNHASWGSQSDVFIIFMNQEAYDKYKLNEEDYAIYKELEKKATDKKTDSKEKDDSKKDSKSKDDKKSSDIKVELEGITYRIERLTPRSVNLRDAIVTADGETLYYLESEGSGTNLWKVGLRKSEHKQLSKVEGNGYFDHSADWKELFILGSNMKKLDPKSDKLTPISYSSTLKINHANEREAMFDDMVNEERERFYRTDMHGVDWTALSEHYRGFLPYINNNYDYAELLSELLGELNVSHTGCRYRPQNSANSERTTSLGLLFNLNYTGKGLKIDEVVENGPFDKSSSKVKAGCIIEKINGVAIDNQDNDYTILLNDISGKKTLVSVYDPAGGSRFDEVVVPITASAMSDLLYNRWVKQRAADVDKWSNGRLGYVHIQSMGDPSFRTMYADVLGKYNDREGIVIDIRWNGGGRLHEDVEILFSGKKYFTQVIRGIESCDMPSRRWNKPSIMVQNEACYSNAHGTPWVYKHQGLGKLVGMPVAGTMTSVNWVTMQDRTLVYGIPVVGYRLPDGSYLENTQLEPDIKVVNTPESIVLGQDLQLKAAVDELLKELSNK